MPSRPQEPRHHALSDIEGKTLGVAEGDLSFRLWPALAKQNGIKAASVKLDQLQPRGARTDAVGRPGRCRDWIFLSVGDQSERPRRPGRRPCGAAVCRLRLRGLWLCRIVNPALAAAKPDAVKGFLRAVIAGTHLAIKDPARAVDEVLSRMDGGSRDLELERLRTVLARQYPDRRSEAQRHRRHRSGPLRALDRSDR